MIVTDQGMFSFPFFTKFSSLCKLGIQVEIDTIHCISSYENCKLKYIILNKAFSNCLEV